MGLFQGIILVGIQDLGFHKIAVHFGDCRDTWIL